MNNSPKKCPLPMTTQEYARRYADACVKADVVPGPMAPCEEVANTEGARLAAQESGKTADGDAVREAPGAGSV